MKKIYSATSLFICCFFAVFSLSVLSTGVNTQLITVEGGYVRETIPGTVISSAYMTITNTSDQQLILTGATSDRSPRIEIHEHTMSGGMMRMRQKQSIVINAKESVVLQPSGLHLMIFDLPRPLQQDEVMPFTLHFTGTNGVNVRLPVQGIKKKTHNHHH